MTPPPRRGRGRPPGSKNKKPKKGSPKKRATFIPPHKFTHPMLVRYQKLHDLFRQGFEDRNPRRKFLGYGGLAKLFGCGKSTIKRDILYLRDQHRMPIDFLPERNGWGYTREVTHLPNLFVTEGDLLILCAAWGGMEGRRNSPFGEKIRPTMEKMMAALGYNLSFDYTTVSERIAYRSNGYHHAIDVTIFETVVSALLNQRELRFTYRKPSTDGTLPEPEERIGQPRCLACIDHAWYIFVDDLGRDGKTRSFALYRMTAATDTGKPFVPTRPFDLEATLGDSTGVHTGGTKATVELHFKPSVAGYAREILWHKTERFTSEPDGSLRLEMDVLVNAELEMKIQRWGSKVEVLNPPDLREKFAGYARESMAMYGAPSSSSSSS